jgi:hypothetical protein
MPVAVIGGDDKQRVLPLAGCFEAIYQPADLIVVVRHPLVVETAGGVEQSGAFDAGLLESFRRVNPGIQPPGSGESGRLGQLALRIVESLAQLLRSKESGKGRRRVPRPVHVGSLKVSPVRLGRVGFTPFPEVVMELCG